MDTILLLLPIALVVVLYFYLSIFKKKKFDKEIILATLAASVIYLLVSFIVIKVSIGLQEFDTEIWSGQIIGHYHKEEWDEWHPPRIETYTTTENGKTVTKTRTIPGYWEHHPAINRITTSDGGDINVYESRYGVKFDDNYPNTEDELRLHFPIGFPSSSTHIYKNKVQSSYSIFRHGI